MLISLRAESFAHLAEHAIGVCREKRHSRIVCGPITSGGLGDFRANLEVFCAVVTGLQTELGSLAGDGQELVFNQLAYEAELWRLLREWQRANPGREDHNPILEEFYLPLFMAADFQIVHFIPRWETSKGTRWEREYFDKRPGPDSFRHISFEDTERYLARWRSDPLSDGVIDLMLAHRD